MKGDEFDGKHDAIIDEVTFRAAQRELQRRLGNKGTRGKHLLSRMMVCGECGEFVYYFTSRQAKSNGRVYEYVRVVCNGKKRGTCDTHSFLAKEIEDMVIQQIKNVSDEEFTDSSGELPQDSIIQDIERRIAHNEEQQERLIDAVQQGLLPNYRVKERLAKLEEEMRGLRQQLDDALAKAPKENIPEFQDTLRTIRDVWDDLDFEDQRAAIRLLVRRIYIFKDKTVRIEFAV